MISTAICLPNLELNVLPGGATISNVYVLDTNNYARGVINNLQGRLTTYFPTYYDQVAKLFIENYFDQNKNTVEIIVSNYEPIEVHYERFIENNREFFRCPQGTNRELSKEICADRRISNKSNILIYNGRPYKIDVYERMFFSLAYLCKTYIKQDIEKGILLSELSSCLLDGLFLAKSNIDYTQTIIPSVFSAGKACEIIGPVTLRNSKLETTMKGIHEVYNLHEELLLNALEINGITIKEDEIEEKVIEADTITVHQLISEEYTSKGYTEVSDLENLKGDFDEILPIKNIYICGDDDGIYVEINDDDPNIKNIPNIITYVDKCLQKSYGIFATEIF